MRDAEFFLGGNSPAAAGDNRGVGRRNVQFLVLVDGRRVAELVNSVLEGFEAARLGDGHFIWTQGASSSNVTLLGAFHCHT